MRNETGAAISAAIFTHVVIGALVQAESNGSGTEELAKASRTALPEAPAPDQTKADDSQQLGKFEIPSVPILVRSCLDIGQVLFAHWCKIVGAEPGIAMTSRSEATH